MTPTQSLELMRAIRGNIVNRLQNLNDEQLHQIPAGFNANIHWQLGHLVVTPALLTFKLSGLEMPLPPEMVAAFAKGSAPSEASAAFPRKVLEAGLVSILDDIESAFSAERFSAFDAYKTSAGITLESAEHAIAYASMHDGIHFGYTLALARILEQH